MPVAEHTKIKTTHIDIHIHRQAWQNIVPFTPRNCCTPNRLVARL